MKVIRLLRARRMPILQQLRIEEALLRADTGNWCLLNDGCAQPAIVLGISGKPQELIHIAEAKKASIQVIKRFTGGGTVVVDQDTLFATLIMQAAALPDVECFPRPVMQWTEQFYQPIFGSYGDYHLREHDYVFGERKFGGNAQAITKQRWLHHTSLLWRFQPQRMRLLKHPAKTPEYRAGRDHLDFICSLGEFMPNRSAVLDAITAHLADLGFTVELAPWTEATELLNLNYVKSNRLLDL